MPKKNRYTLTLRCAETGCKENIHYGYDNRKDYVAAQARYKTWLCSHHRRVAITPTQNEREFTETYRLSHRFTFNGYQPTWKHNDEEWSSGDVRGELWSARTVDFPVGTRIAVTTTVTAYVPVVAEPVPEWKTLDLERSDKWETLKQIDEDETLLLSHTGILMVHREIDGRDAYRLPTDADREGLSFPWFRRGQHVLIKYWDATDYHRYEWAWQTVEATVIEQPSKPLFLKALTVNGREYEVYLGHVTPLTSHPDTENGDAS